MLLATVLGSGVAFLDGTIVNVALPAIAEDLDAGIGDLQWVLNAYLVTLSAFVLLGGTLGDRYGRKRVFLIGLVGFTAASILCGLAPNVGVLIARPCRPGPRGGSPRPRQPGHPVGHLPSRRPGSGRRRVVGTRRGRRCRRPVHGWVADRRRVVAAGVPDQRASGGRCGGGQPPRSRELRRWRTSARLRGCRDGLGRSGPGHLRPHRVRHHVRPRRLGRPRRLPPRGEPQPRPHAPPHPVPRPPVQRRQPHDLRRVRRPLRSLLPPRPRAPGVAGLLRVGGGLLPPAGDAADADPLLAGRCARPADRPTPADDGGAARGGGRTPPLDPGRRGVDLCGGRAARRPRLRVGSGHHRRSAHRDDHGVGRRWPPRCRVGRQQRRGPGGRAAGRGRPSPGHRPRRGPGPRLPSTRRWTTPCC